MNNDSILFFFNEKATPLQLTCNVLVSGIEHSDLPFNALQSDHPDKSRATWHHTQSLHY